VIIVTNLIVAVSIKESVDYERSEINILENEDLRFPTLIHN
jgi:hypothetical protein